MLWKHFVRQRSAPLRVWNHAALSRHISAMSYSRISHFGQQYLCYQRSLRRTVATRLNSIRYLHDTLDKCPSTSADFRVVNERDLPTREQLFYVDWLTDLLVPKFLGGKEIFVKFMKLCTENVVYDDSIFNRHVEGIDKFIRHVSLSQLYFSLMRASCVLQKLGACIYENDDVVVVLWRMTAVRLYHQEREITEGALDIHVNKDGKIYKIRNRPITRDDHEGAAVLARLKEAPKSEPSEASATSKMQMRSMWRYLVRFAAPSSACLLLSRAYCTGRGSKGPEMFQLEHIRKRLEETVPQFFRQRPDFTFYRPNVEYKDEIFQTIITGRDKLMMYFGTVSVICLFLFPHIEMEALNILPISEDGTVRLRWRVKHVSLIRAILNPMLIKYDYRIKRLKWYDGYSTFYVGSDGLVYRVVTRRTIEDDRKNAQTNRLTDLAQKVGVLPKGSAAFLAQQRSSRRSAAPPF